MRSATVDGRRQEIGADVERAHDERGRPKETGGIAVEPRIARRALQTREKIGRQILERHLDAVVAEFWEVGAELLAAVPAAVEELTDAPPGASGSPWRRVVPPTSTAPSKSKSSTYW